MRALGFGVLILLMGATAPAAAQSSPARQNQEIFDVRNKESDYFEHVFRNAARLGSEGYSDALRFAHCVARYDPSATDAVVAADAGSQAEERSIRGLMRRYKTCAITGQTLPSLVLRGAIAETLWKQHGANPNPSNRETVEISDVEGFIKARPLGESAIKSAGMPLSWVARCQVMALPNKAAEILAAEPGSAKEKAEAETLYANSRVCGVQNGLGQTPVVAVRAALADALLQNYRRSAPRANQ